MADSNEIIQRAENTVGKVLRDKWHLDRLLGVGGMAAVYAASHRNGQRAAIKILHPEAALAPRVKERFLREGYLANRVDHPGAVNILDDDVDADGTVYLVMELLRGETLEARLDRLDSALPADELLQMTHAILDCLVTAHEKGIVHRDLKPGNLFITDDGQLKILDFGIASLMADKKPSGATAGAQALGTPGFMPPEQARGHWERVDARSDLWAVGAVMFASLTGRFVHEASTGNEQLLAAMTEPVVPIRELLPELAEEAAQVIDRALEFEKGARWPDAESMRTAVAASYQSLTGKSLEQAPRLSARPPRVSVTNSMATTLDEESVQVKAQGTTARPVANTRPPTQSAAFKVGLAISLAVAAAVLVMAVRPESQSTDQRRLGEETSITPVVPAANPSPSPAAAHATARSESDEDPVELAEEAEVSDGSGATHAASSTKPEPASGEAVSGPRSAARPVKARATLAPAPQKPAPSKPAAVKRASVPAQEPKAATSTPDAPAPPSPEEVDLFSRRR